MHQLGELLIYDRKLKILTKLFAFTGGVNLGIGMRSIACSCLDSTQWITFVLICLWTDILHCRFTLSPHYQFWMLFRRWLYFEVTYLCQIMTCKSRLFDDTMIVKSVQTAVQKSLTFRCLFIHMQEYNHSLQKSNHVEKYWWAWFVSYIVNEAKKLSEDPFLKLISLKFEEGHPGTD